MKFLSFGKGSCVRGIFLGILMILLASDSPIQITQEVWDDAMRRTTTFWEKVDREYRLSMGNLGVLELALERAYLYEFRYPATFQEALQSPYMPILPGDFINPYTGAPVKEVQGEPTPGDVKYIYSPEGPEIGIYLKAPSEDLQYLRHPSLGIPTVDIPTRRSPGELFYHPLLILKSYTKSVNKAISPENRELYNWLARGWTDEEKRLLTFCVGIERILFHAPTYYGKEVLNWTWQELQRRMDWEWNFRVRNPYTGDWVKPVDPRTPSPGDFSVLLDVDENTLMPGVVRYHGWSMCVAYDDKGEPIRNTDPLMLQTLEKNPQLHILR